MSTSVLTPWVRIGAPARVDIDSRISSLAQVEQFVVIGEFVYGRSRLTIVLRDGGGVLRAGWAK